MQKRRKRRSGIITLITDFGLQAEYAGAMKGAILTVNPKSQVVDITHQIPPHDILRACFVLKNSYPYYPKGTVHVVVVDPGVGTARRPLIVESGGHLFVGPDNGVFGGILSAPGERSAYEINRKEFFRKPLSLTFHGRDLFAPVAGHLSMGRAPQEFGPRVFDCQRVEWPRPKMDERKLTGEILWADPFGNLITNIGGDVERKWLAGRPWLIKGRNWKIERLSQTFAEEAPGKPLALFGSSGFLELSVNQGRAIEVLKMGPGDPVVLRRR
jgi:S-adenosylmethionine hydrolase